MDIVSLCPLKVSGFEWLSSGGARALTVMCKATFDLRPGEATLAEEQEAPNDRDLYWNDDPSCSVRSPSDRAPYKPRADVVLVGHVYPPGERPAPSFTARIVVGEVDKSIEIGYDRGLQLPGGQLLYGPHVSTMELRRERASAGLDTTNPVGTRFHAEPDQYEMAALEDLQPAETYIASRGETIEPLSFAPIPPTWPSRAQRLGPYAKTFATHGWENSPLPVDFDYSYFNVAPQDQQVTALRPNERIVLENLHAEHARLATILPGIWPRAIVDRATGEREEIALVADTLWIDVDREICSLLWRGRIWLRHAQEAGRVVFWADGLGATEPSAAGAAPVHALSPAGTLADPDEGVTLTMGLGVPMPAKDPLPFVHGAAAMASLPSPPMFAPAAALDEARSALEPPRPEAPLAPVKKEARPEDFALERCAALTATIARRKPDKAKILEEQELSAAQWAAIEKHWDDAIQVECKRGKKTLLDRFDAAYVEQLERERGPIEVGDYAKLMVATERGALDEALGDVGLPRGALMRIERAWMKRMMKDAALGQRVEEEIDKIRAR